jgi:Dihydropteroate synthase (EC 2.5.1.15)
LRSRLGRVWVGDGEPVRIMGVINLSPESFYRGSVRASADDVLRAVESMVRDGADLVDLGGMSTLRTTGPLSAPRRSWAG